MRAQEFVQEKINDKTVNTGFRDQQTVPHATLGDLTISAEGETRQVHNTQANVLHVRVLDGQGDELAWADFLVRTRREDGEQWLESAYTHVRPNYRRQGLSRIMYQYVNDLGNEIAPSGLQTDLGRGMWQGLSKTVRQPTALPAAPAAKPSLWQRLKKTVVPA